MSNNTNKEIFYTLAQIQKYYRFPLNKIKETLVKKKVCELDGLRVKPFPKYIALGEILEFDSQYENNEKYYKYSKGLVTKLFKQKQDPLLNPMTWKEAQKNLTNFQDKLEKILGNGESFYFHGIRGFEYEVEEYLVELLNHIDSFSNAEQKIINTNYEYFRRKR